MTTTAEDVWQLIAELAADQKETEQRFQETERLLREQSQETERLLRVSQRVRKRLDGKTLEIDVLVMNEHHVLVVEVKSSLGVDDVKELIEDLRTFRQFFPEYSQKQLYGAVAGIEIEEGAEKYAYRQGLFVLAQTGEAVAILNELDFQPKCW